MQRIQLYQRFAICFRLAASPTAATLATGVARRTFAIVETDIVKELLFCRVAFPEMSTLGKKCAKNLDSQSLLLATGRGRMYIVY